MKKYIILLFFVVMLSCEDSEQPADNREPAIYGIATDISGNPIANAEVWILYDIPEPGGVISNKNENILEDTIEIPENDFEIINYPNPFNDLFVYKFVNLKSSRVKIDIKSLATEKVYFSSDKILDPGIHQYYFNAKSLIDTTRLVPYGLYYVTIQFDDTIINSRNNPVLHYDKNQYYHLVESITKTDKNGKFVLPYKYFHIGSKIKRIHDSGRIMGTITMSAKAEIAVFKEEDGLFYDRVYPVLIKDKNRPMNINVELLGSK